MNQTPIVKTLHWLDEQACQTFAVSLSARAGLQNAVLYLQGNLGSGKTTFTRYLLQALGVSGRIKSPTYAVVEPYELPTAQGVQAIWHFDFYRFSDPSEWADAGLRDLFVSPGLKLCEWPEKARGYLPSPDLDIYLTVHHEHERAVRSLCR